VLCAVYVYMYIYIIECACERVPERTAPTDLARSWATQARLIMIMMTKFQSPQKTCSSKFKLNCNCHTFAVRVGVSGGSVCLGALRFKNKNKNIKNKKININKLRFCDQTAINQAQVVASPPHEKDGRRRGHLGLTPELYRNGYFYLRR